MDDKIYLVSCEDQPELTHAVTSHNNDWWIDGYSNEYSKKLFKPIEGIEPLPHWTAQPCEELTKALAELEEKQSNHTLEFSVDVSSHCPKLLKDFMDNLDEGDVRAFVDPVDEEEKITVEAACWDVEPKKFDNTLGRKYDDGKLQWSLVPWEALEEVVEVLMFGAKKYERDNWKYVDDANRRYNDAALRHLIAANTGEALDPESGKHHKAHAICCLLFDLWLEKQQDVEHLSCKARQAV